MEAAVLLAFQHIRIDGLTQLLVFLSSFSNSALIWVILGIALFLFGQRKETGLLLIATVVITGLVFYLLLSHFLVRPRPTEEVQGLTAVLGVVHSGGSFPCFHSLTSFAAVTVLYKRCSPRIATIFGIYALFVSICQLYFGVSYPTDVLIGAIMGVAVALLLTFVFEKVFWQGLPDKPAHTRKKVR